MAGSDGYGDPVQYVEGWLKRHGYHIEYDVARRLRAQGLFEVEQGRYWRDTDPLTRERKGRELDVVAIRRGERTITQLVIECKYIQRPWVIFQREGAMTLGFEATIERLMAGRPARTFLAEKYRSARRPWHLKPAAAFNIVETRDEQGKRPADTAFDVVSDLIRGAWAIHNGSTPKPMNAITIPVLVVAGDLVSVSFDATGNQVIRSTDFERVTWAGAVLPGPKGYERDSPVTVDVLTVRALDNWVPDATRSLSEIFSALEGRP